MWGNFFPTFPQLNGVPLCQNVIFERCYDLVRPCQREPDYYILLIIQDLVAETEVPHGTRTPLLDPAWEPSGLDCPAEVATEWNGYLRK